MSFDYKKEYKEFYMPKNIPSIVNIPAMNYIAVRGRGNPNLENGEYKESIELLYTIAFTIKMSYKSDYKIKDYFEYVVPPLEGLWWQDGNSGIDYNKKDELNFISLIRLPDFVTEEDFNWAINSATIKKKRDFSKVKFFVYNEGECVQCMHIGSYDNEPETIKAMNEYAYKNGYKIDMNGERLHHEIYLSDPRRCSDDKLKTVIRHPVVKKFDMVMSKDNLLLANLDKIHTTKLGNDRIRKTLKLSVLDVVPWCIMKIKKQDAIIFKHGKNYYVDIDNCRLTINSYSYTIITASIIKR